MSEPDTPEALHVQAQRALLDGLRRGDALSELERAVRHSQTRRFTPDLAVLEVGVAALDLARVGRRAPIFKSELVEQHLTELDFRKHRKPAAFVMTGGYAWYAGDPSMETHLPFDEHVSRPYVVGSKARQYQPQQQPGCLVSSQRRGPPRPRRQSSPSPFPPG